MPGPIKPDDVTALKTAALPDEVFEVFNELIVSRWAGGQAIISQGDVVEHLESKGFSRERIYGEHLLNVEESYRAVGWKVEYDRPGYNETYQPTFKFSRQVR